MPKCLVEILACLVFQPQGIVNMHTCFIFQSIVFQQRLHGLHFVFVKLKCLQIRKAPVRFRVQGVNCNGISIHRHPVILPAYRLQMMCHAAHGTGPVG